MEVEKYFSKNDNTLHILKFQAAQRQLLKVLKLTLNLNTYIKRKMNKFLKFNSVFPTGFYFQP